MSADALGVGIGVLDGMPAHERAGFLADAADAGLDCVVNWDHVSFRGGWGTDGLVRSAADCGLHPALGVFVSVFLLTLRHPVLVARQLSTLSEVAPGRLVLGVGVGGDDRGEMRLCGVDPRTRGARMEEHLTVLRGLLAQDAFSFDGRFVQVQEATIQPRPDPPVPLVVGGRSELAIRRGGRHGDGWIGVWNTAAQYTAAVTLFGDEAARAGRPDGPWRHAVQIWCGLGPTAEAAHARVAAGIESFVRLPFRHFERYCAWGRPDDIAAFVAPYVQAGCRHVNFVACAADRHEAVEGIGEVARMLRGAHAVA